MHSQLSRFLGGVFTAEGTSLGGCKYPLRLKQMWLSLNVLMLIELCVVACDLTLYCGFYTQNIPLHTVLITYLILKRRRVARFLRNRRASCCWNRSFEIGHKAENGLSLAPQHIPIWR